MKTLVFIACLLAMAYANETANTFFKSMCDCSKKLNIKLNMEKPHPKIFYCALKIFGEIDENGKLLPNKWIENTPDFLPNCCDHIKATKWLYKCFNGIYDGLKKTCKKDAYQNITLEGLECVTPVLSLLEKPNIKCN